MTMRRQVLYIFTIITFAFAQSAFAETVIIRSSATANSGGNSASGGEVVVGEATAELFMETVVDSEIVSSVHKKEVSTSGKVVLEESFTYTSDDVSVEGVAEAEASIEDIEEYIATPTASKVEMPERGMLVHIKQFFTYVFSLFK